MRQGTSWPAGTGVACGRAFCLALTLLLGSCTNPGIDPSTALAPPERAAVSAATKPMRREVDVAPLAAAHKAKPADPAAAVALARALRDQGSSPQAQAVLDKTSAMKPADKRLLLERGLLALELGDPSKAEALLKKAQDDKAPDWRLNSALGTALASCGKQQEAQVQFAKALQLAPDHPSILNNLALSYALDGKAEEAERLLRKARQAKSAAEPEKVQQNLALVLGLRGKFEEARVAANGALPAAKAQGNVAYLQDLATTRAANAPAQSQAQAKPEPTADQTAQRASASLPQPVYQLGASTASDR